MDHGHGEYDNIFHDKIFQEPSVMYIDEYFTATGQSVVTTITVVTLTLGLICNAVVLVFFYKVVVTKAVQSSLWTNLSGCYLAKCLVMLYSAIGDVFDGLSNTEDKCRVRFALPLSMDLICINCFLMILIERTIAIHCPEFYSFLPQHNILIHWFCWAYGGSYFLFIMLQMQYYDCPSECLTPYTHMTPMDSVQTFSFMTAVLLILACLISMLFLYPSQFSKVERIRLQMEINGTYLVVAFGTAVLVFWIPRQIIICLFWLGNINLANYTLSMKIATLVLEFSVLIPFTAMLATNEFRTAVYCMLTMAPLRPVKRKIMAQESYKSTIRKLVEAERKASSSLKERSKFSSFSNRSFIDRQMGGPQQNIHQELQARNDYLIGQDLTVTPNMDI